jgi:hypothetical protein
MVMLGIRRCREEEMFAFARKEKSKACLGNDTSPNALPLPELFEHVERAVAARHREGTGRYERGTADSEATGLGSHRYE